MLVARRSLLIICILLAPLLSMVFIRASSQALAAPTASPSIIHIADVPQARGVAFDTAGNLFALSRDTGIISKITPSGQISTVVDLPDGDDGYVGPVFDASTGNLFVAKNMWRSGTDILQITPAGGVSIFTSQAPNPVVWPSTSRAICMLLFMTALELSRKITPSGERERVCDRSMPAGWAGDCAQWRPLCRRSWHRIR